MLHLLAWQRYLTLFLLLSRGAPPSAGLLAVASEPTLNVTTLVLGSNYNVDKEVIGPLQILRPAFHLAQQHRLVRRALGDRVNLREEFVDFGCEHNVSLKRIMHLTCDGSQLLARQEPRFIAGVLCSYPLNNLNQYMLRPNDAVVSTGALSSHFFNMKQLVRIGTTAEDAYRVLRCFIDRLGGWRNMFFMARNTVRGSKPPHYYVDFLQSKLIQRAVEHQLKSEPTFRYEHVYVDSLIEEGVPEIEAEELYRRILLERVSTKFSGEIPGPDGTPLAVGQAPYVPTGTFPCVGVVNAY